MILTYYSIVSMIFVNTHSTRNRDLPKLRPRHSLRAGSTGFKSSATKSQLLSNTPGDRQTSSLTICEKQLCRSETRLTGDRDLVRKMRQLGTS
jgi:hypothetical protein